MDFFKIMNSFAYFISPSRHPANNSSVGQQENLVSNAQEEGSHLITNQEEEKQEQNSATRTDVASFFSSSRIAVNNSSLCQQENFMGSAKSHLTDQEEDRQEQNQMIRLDALPGLNLVNVMLEGGQVLSENDKKRKYMRETKRNYREKRRKKNSDDDSSVAKQLTEKQLEHNCDLAINEKKCSNNRKVLNSIWKYETDDSNKFKDLVLLDLNLGDDISTMKHIFDLISGKSFQSKMEPPSIIGDQECFLKNRLAFFYVPLDNEYLTHVKKITTKLDRDYRKYYLKNFRKDTFPEQLNSQYLFGGFKHYTAWKFLNAKALKMFLNFHCPLKEIIYCICDNQRTKELLILTSIIFDPVHNVKHKDRFLPEHNKKHQDFFFTSGNNWVFLLPLDEDESILDGVSAKRGNGLINISYKKYQEDVSLDEDEGMRDGGGLYPLLMMGGDVPHRSNDRIFGKNFASSNKKFTQRRLLQLIIAPMSTLFLLEMIKTSFAEDSFEEVVFVIKSDTKKKKNPSVKKKKNPDIKEIKIRNLTKEEKEEALSWSKLIDLDSDN